MPPAVTTSRRPASRRPASRRAAIRRAAIRRPAIRRPASPHSTSHYATSRTAIRRTSSAATPPAVVLPAVTPPAVTPHLSRRRSRTTARAVAPPAIHIATRSCDAADHIQRAARGVCADDGHGQPDPRRVRRRLAQLRSLRISGASLGVALVHMLGSTSSACDGAVIRRIWRAGLWHVAARYNRSASGVGTETAQTVGGFERRYRTCFERQSA